MVMPASVTARVSRNINNILAAVTAVGGRLFIVSSAGVRVVVSMASMAFRIAMLCVGALGRVVTHEGRCLDDVVERDQLSMISWVIPLLYLHSKILSFLYPQGVYEVYSTYF